MNQIRVIIFFFQNIVHLGPPDCDGGHMTSESREWNANRRIDATKKRILSFYTQDLIFYLVYFVRCRLSTTIKTSLLFSFSFSCQLSISLLWANLWYFHRCSYICSRCYIWKIKKIFFSKLVIHFIWSMERCEIMHILQLAKIYILVHIRWDEKREMHYLSIGLVSTRTFRDSNFYKEHKAKFETPEVLSMARCRALLAL